MCETKIKCKECSGRMSVTQCPVGDGIEVSIYCTNESCRKFEEVKNKILYEPDFD